MVTLRVTAAPLEVFRKHCIKCHGKHGKVKGKVDLLVLKSKTDLKSRPELLEELLGVLVDREMPPEDEPGMPESDRSATILQLRSMLKEAGSKASFKTVPMRRMNRFQYNNAVVDLLEMDRDIFQLNERLMRRRSDYFNLASKKMPDEVRVSSRPLSKDVDNERPEGFRGVAAFPQDKRAEHGFDNRADHLTMSPLLMESFLQLSQSIARSPDLNPKECRSWGWLFAAPGQPVHGPKRGRVEAEDPKQVSFHSQGPVAEVQNLKHYGNQWGGDTHLLWKCEAAGQSLTLQWNAKEAASGLRIGLTTAGDYGIFEIQLDGKVIGSPVNLRGPRVDRMDHEIDAAIQPGPHTLTFKCTGKDGRSPRFYFGLDFIAHIGLKPPRKTGLPAVEVKAIRERVGRLLRRAFRRPVSAVEVERFAGPIENQISSGVSWEDSMRLAVATVLGMPDFLYFYEVSNPGESPGGRQRISEFELASRLAQFLWSSIPDDALLALAEGGRLSDPQVLDGEIDRMLNDRKVSRFCDNFPGQWLQLDRLITSIPDPKKFPYFYYNGYRSSIHMMSEPLLLFETALVEDRSIMDLLAPDFTWESSMLKANYDGHSRGGKDVQIQRFRRAPAADHRRGGVIANAAVMTMTSTPTRTQPITRGAWINAVIFNDPPEPPPADVPPLDESDKADLAKLTIRERLAAHRERPDCAGCHNQIDPLGFALENFGPTGVWRDKYANGRDIDVSGTLFNKHEFQSFAKFKQLLLREKPRFTRGFISHLLSYALCREVGPADTPALDAMTASALDDQDNLRAVLKSIAMSDPFLHKNTLDTGNQH